MALLGIDLGSSALKATVIDEETGLNVTSAVSYPEDWVGERPGHLERHIETYWEALRLATAKLAREAGVPLQSIEAISFSVQGETFSVLDQDFGPLRKAIQGHDVRAQEEAVLLRERFGEERLHSISGQPGVDAYWVGAKLLWIKRNQPEIFAKIRRFLMLEGYIIFKLTGRKVSERSIIANSYLYDMGSGNWFLPMFDFLGLSPDIMPEVVGPGSPLGEVSRQAARDTGLSENTLVVAGVLDQVAAALGAGSVHPGVITETTGTALALGVIAKGSYEGYLGTGLPVYYHAVPDAFFLMPWLGSGGLTLQWFRDNFAEFEKLFAAKADLETYELLTIQAARISPGSDGLILLPFLSGANCPEFDTSARGVFFGITPGHGKPHFVRAILEAIGYAIRANLELVRSAGIEIEQLRSMGGGARSRLWTQIKADICGIPITPMTTSDSASLGAALLAGVGAGRYSSLEAASRSRFIQMGERIQPDGKNKAVYDAGFLKYREIYGRLKGCF